ncbi:MAG: hypothetical protein IT538_05735, partial [Variibacter sp.]|nr:hypothetical protein [Variibacter sp.]
MSPVPPYTPQPQGGPYGAPQGGPYGGPYQGQQPPYGAQPQQGQQPYGAQPHYGAPPPYPGAMPVADSTPALVVYILYFVGYITGITAIVGVIIAHVQMGETVDPVLKSHYQFQVRTFWIGLLYLAVGTVLTMVVVGVAVLLWWFVWSLVRCIKGVLALNER